MPSWLTGTGSVETGNDSALTATGVCAPLHPDFIKDGTSFLTGQESVLTATTPPTCESPGECLPEGTLLFDQTYAAEHTVSATPNVFFELTGIPFEDWGTCPLKLEITLDLLDVFAPPHVPPAPTSLYAYVNTPGLAAGDFLNDAIATMVSFGNTIYQTKAMVNLLNQFDDFVIFNGPGVAQSIYFWPPVLFPTFFEGKYQIKNIHVVITAA